MILPARFAPSSSTHHQLFLCLKKNVPLVSQSQLLSFDSHNLKFCRVFNIFCILSSNSFFLIDPQVPQSFQARTPAGDETTRMRHGHRLPLRLHAARDVGIRNIERCRALDDPTLCLGAVTSHPKNQSSQSPYRPKPQLPCTRERLSR